MDKRLKKIPVKKLWIEDTTYNGNTRKQENSQVYTSAPVTSSLSTMLRDKTNDDLVRSDKK